MCSRTCTAEGEISYSVGAGCRLWAKDQSFSSLTELLCVGNSSGSCTADIKITYLNLKTKNTPFLSFTSRLNHENYHLAGNLRIIV